MKIFTCRKNGKHWLEEKKPSLPKLPPLRQTPKEYKKGKKSSPQQFQFFGGGGLNE
jgi:hypothetical protein